MFRENGLILQNLVPSTTSPTRVFAAIEPPGVPLRFVLASLKAGQAGTITRIIAEPQQTRRLADMGFVRGVELQMVRPGTPCIVRNDGAYVGLGRTYQLSIEVIPARQAAYDEPPFQAYPV